MRLGALLLAMMLSAATPFAQSGKPLRLGPNEGQVLEVDREAREITIRHGYLPELAMDPMAMIFIVADPALLEKVRKGDRVKFKPGLVEGRFAVMSIERIR
jgi:Cu(I)/Ag(I) efflux system periplasmic protein CusF